MNERTVSLPKRTPKQSRAELLTQRARSLEKKAPRAVPVRVSIPEPLYALVLDAAESARRRPSQMVISCIEQGLRVFTEFTPPPNVFERVSAPLPEPDYAFHQALGETREELGGVIPASPK